METISKTGEVELNKILDFALSIKTFHNVKKELSIAVKNGEFEKAWETVLYYSVWFSYNGWDVAGLANTYVMAGKKYYPDGRVNAVVPYIGGVKHGIVKVWHPNGKLKSEYVCANGKHQGVYRSYYDNGAKETECTYVDGLLDGTHTLWYKDGRVCHCEEFSKGEPVY